MKFIILLFTLWILICVGIKTYDKCYCGELKTPNCITYGHTISNECKPQFGSLPPNGCKINTMHVRWPAFVYKQYDNVSLTYLCPNNSSIYYNNNNNLANYLTNEKGCFLNGKNFTCIPYIDYKCPEGCQYNQITNKCDPTNLKYNCGLINKTLKCPSNCDYNANYNKCIPEDINYVCGLEKSLYCPDQCTLSPNGKLCMFKDGTLCEHVDINPCPDNCQYSKKYNRCIPNTINDLCEPMTKVTCENEHYQINQTIELCDRFNMDKLCRINNYLIYPSKLHNEYSDLKCNYPIKINCELMPGKLTKCPGKINTLYNSCTAPKGSLPNTYLTECPIGYHYISSTYGNEHLCVNNKNNKYNSIVGINKKYGKESLSQMNDFKCKENYELINIKSYFYCTMSWYLRDN